MAFSATESAFEGFRLARRSPLTIVIWAVAYGLMTLGFLWLAGDSMTRLMEVSESMEAATGASDPDQIMALFGQMMDVYASLIWPLAPLAIVASAVLDTAVNRAVVRPSESAFGYLRLGMDEVRVFVVSLVVGIVVGLFCFLLVAVGAGILFAASAAIGDNAGLISLVGIVLFLVLVAAIIWMVVRLSLALPITVAERRFAFFDSWRMTRGHVWGLIGMALLAFVMAIVVQILLSIVLLPILFLAGGGFEDLFSMAQLNPAELFQTLSPVAIAMIVFGAVLSALQVAIMYAPFASAYLGLKGRDPGADSATSEPDPVAG